MMIVMPALAQGKQGNDRIVAAGVAGRVASRSPHVSQGVHHESGVVKDDSRDYETPDQHLRAIGAPSRTQSFEQLAETIKAECQQHRRHDIKTIKESQFGKLQPILH